LAKFLKDTVTMTEEKKPGGKMSNFRHMTRALQYRNYRLFFIGQGISLIGTWMQRVGVGWLVYRLTDSPFLLGLVTFSGQIPTFLLAPVAGVLTDRMDRMKLLIASQVLSMIQALLLAFFVLTNIINIYEIIGLSILLGLINAFEITTRQSLVIEMVDKKEDLSNAIALNSTIFNGARLIGPSVAGILIASVGEGICFLINGLSFIAVIYSLMAMKLNLKPPKKHKSDILHGLKEGFAYSFGFAPIRSILMNVALVNFMGMPYVTLLPVFARDVLGGGANTLGFLMGAFGMGALISAFSLAFRKNVVGLEKWISIAGATLGCGLILFSFSNSFWISLLISVPAGFGMMFTMVSSNTILQTISEDEMRGRLMSQYAMSFMGMAPLGSLVGGSLAGRIGAPNTLIIGGAFCILGAILFARKLPQMRELVRPIYRKKGIIPEIAGGLQSAAEGIGKSAKFQ
jgi:MFS family permease